MSFLRFTHPAMLWFLWGLPLLVGLRIYSNWRRKQALKRFGDAALVAELTRSVDLVRRRWKTALFLVGYACLVVAMAGPQVGTKIAYAKRQGLDILVALDTSLSMQAEDVSPNRFTKAKHEIATLLQKLNGDRIGLIAFAGTSFVQCPLTTDYQAARMFLDILTVQSIPQQGSLLGSAIQKALETFEQQRSDDDGKHAASVLLLLTDGEAHDPSLEQATEKATAAGLRVFAIGVGETEPGSPIPIYDRYGQRVGYKQDRQGTTVITRLQEDTLRRLTAATQGHYFRATPSESEIDAFYAFIDQLERRLLEERQYTGYEDRSTTFLWIALICLGTEWVLSDRRSGSRIVV